MAGDLGDSNLAKILSFLDGLFGIFSGAVSKAVRRALNALRDALIGIGEELATLGKGLRSFLARLVGPFRRLYAHVLKPLWFWLRERMIWLRDWLHKIFDPLIRALQRIRTHLLNIYKRFIRPVLDVIDAIRFVLQTLGRLGVEWAQKLDAKLAEIEHVITDKYNYLLGELNKAIDVLDSVVTFDRLFQRLPLLRSLDRDAPYWLRIWWNKQVVGLTPDQAAAARSQKYSFNDPVDTRVQLTAFYITGGGTLAPVIKELVPTWKAAAGYGAAPARVE